LDVVGVTLDDLTTDLGAHKHIEEIEDISGCAQGEKQIEEAMKGVDLRWND